MSPNDDLSVAELATSFDSTPEGLGKPKVSATSATTGTVTLVIPGRNCESTLDRCLQSVVPLKESGELQEIIFVDDGSTDATPEIAARYPVRGIQGTGQGPGAARNLGWQAATSELIWFIDSDCVAEPDALSKLVPHLVQPRDSETDGNPTRERGTESQEAPRSRVGLPEHTDLNQSNVVGVGGSYCNLFPDNLLATLIHEEIIARHRRMPREVDFLATFNVIYRRSVLEATRGFNESLKLAQDAEFAYRVRATGDRLNFVLESKVGHHHPTNLWRYLKTQSRQGYYRVTLYREHPTKISGDAYAGLVDYLQPPLACLSVLLMIAAVMAAVASSAAFALLMMLSVLCVVLLAILQLPWVARVAPAMKVRSLAFIPFGILRAFARGFGMMVAFVPHTQAESSKA